MSLGCNMQLLRWFLTIFSSENDRSPVQFVGIMAKYRPIRNAISMFGNVDSRLSALISLYSSDIVGLWHFGSTTTSPSYVILT